VGRRLGDPVLAGALAGAAALRLWGLGAQSLWFDEFSTQQATTGSLLDAAHHIARREGIAPPYFFVMWAWSQAFGRGAVSLRLVSVAAGVATVPIAYAVVGAVGGSRRAARLAAVLVAVNPMLIWYSQEARPYSLLAFAGGLSVLAWARVRQVPAGDGDRTRRALLWWGLAAAGALAVHYFAIFLVAAEAAALVPGRSWRAVAKAAIPVAVVGVAMAPVAWIQSRQSGNRTWMRDFTLASRVREAARTALVGPSVPDGRLWWPAAVALVVAAALLVTVAPPATRAAAAWMAGLGAAAVVVPVVLALAGVDIVLGRYLMAGTVPLTVAVALGLAAPVPRMVVGAAAAAGLVAVSLVAVVAVDRDPDLQRAGWRQVAAAEAAAPGRGLLVLNRGGLMSEPLRAYAPGIRRLDAGDRVTVDRIDVLGITADRRPCNFLVGRTCGLVFLGFPLPPDVAAHFGAPERIRVGAFTIDRYRADRPVTVTPGGLLTGVAPDDAATWRLR